jgi:hypothetical protein
MVLEIYLLEREREREREREKRLFSGFEVLTVLANRPVFCKVLLYSRLKISQRLGETSYLTADED